MCGLVGIGGDLEMKDEATIKRLLVYDYFRGTDSTGLAALRLNGEVHISKVASHPLDLFEMKHFEKALSGYCSSAFLGHNRAATKGKVNSANAHPYQYGKIVGAHNGTLDKASWDRLNKALGYETDVDSQAIFACIDKIGIEETIGLMTEGRASNEGAWALSWVDTEEKSLNFIRNKWRPLWYTYSEDFKKVIWASEWPMIEAATALSTQGYKLHKSKEGYRFWEMHENFHYKYDLAELKKGSDKRPRPRVKEIKGREPAPVVSAAQGTAPFMQNRSGTDQWMKDGWWENGVWRAAPAGGTTDTKKSATTRGSHSHTNDSYFEPPKEVEIPCTTHDPLGAAMSRSRFQEIAQYGCSWCAEEIEWQDVSGCAIYDQYDKVLCSSCAGNNPGQTRLYTSVTELKAIVEIVHGFGAADDLDDNLDDLTSDKIAAVA